MDGFPIRRAWTGCTPDGWLVDRFANKIAYRIEEESHEWMVQGYWPKLVEDFLDRCDAIFVEAGPETAKEVDALAAKIEIADLYELTDEDDDA